MPGLLDDPISPKTKLLTLLNVSATKASKRKRVNDEASSPARKLNKRAQKSISFSEVEKTRELSPIPVENAFAEDSAADIVEEEDSASENDEVSDSLCALLCIP
jgi:U3 small nucleolar RNA-associated protein 25